MCESPRRDQNNPMPPGLNLISSNRVETLLGLLAEEIAARPPTSPFSTETVVVPSPAMARWVNLNLAQENGIAANIHYPLPATWIWEIARGLLEGLPEIDPLSRETAAWKIFFLLPRLLDRQEFIAIKRYLHADPDGIKRWQLSMKIAGVFDRYQFYRPDWISDWCAGKDCVWQALLWRELIETIQSLHRIEVIDAVLASLNQPASNQRLPERVSLFAISSLAPLFVDVIHHLARHTRVLLFLHSPSEHYWA
ncbi:MAG: exodeoxyribonuclease V subunit gamma, partial [Methylococcales bacterium]